MRVTLDPKFVAALDALSPQQQRQVAGALARLRVDASHPSLRLERHYHGDVYTVRLDRKYRLVLRREAGGVFTALGVAHHHDVDARGRRSIKRW